jgi:hypothetical protein
MVQLAMPEFAERNANRVRRERFGQLPSEWRPAERLGRRLESAAALARDFFEIDRAFARCLRVLNALQRTPGAAGDWSKLPLPKEALLDPFDGKPLRRKASPGGIVIYSIGCNLFDNSGDIGNGWYDVGIGPAQ